MHVDATQGGHGENVFGQDLAVSGDNDEVRLQFAQARNALRRVDAGRLLDRNPLCPRDVDHATLRLARRSALVTGRAIRLSDEPHHGMGAAQDRLESRLGEGARPHHDKSECRQR